jgi:ribonuclease P protein component
VVTHKQYGFSREQRVRTKADFDRVYQANFYVADDVLVVRGCRGESTRLGLSISRKVGNAVVRNRWKRRIREVFRQCFAELPDGVDLVIRPRKGARCDYQAIAASLPKLALKIARRLERANG